MTLPPANVSGGANVAPARLPGPAAATGPPVPAVIDGIDVDAVAAAVAACPAVAGLDGGMFGEVASYLPGRIVPGVVVDGGRVRVQVRARWVPAAVVAAQVTAAIAPLARRPVDVVIADIDDPPATMPPAAPVLLPGG